MYAHIHRLQYQVVTDMMQGDAIGMNYIVGSATNYHDKPTMFSVMTLDPELMIPLDYEVWAFDLEYANEYDQPKWYKKYNYKELFHIPNLSPKSFMDHSYE
jgi:hypothetical protein